MQEEAMMKQQAEKTERKLKDKKDHGDDAYTAIPEDTAIAEVDRNDDGIIIDQANDNDDDDHDDHSHQSNNRFIGFGHSHLLRNVNGIHNNHEGNSSSQTNHMQNTAAAATFSSSSSSSSSSSAGAQQSLRYQGIAGGRKRIDQESYPRPGSSSSRSIPRSRSSNSRGTAGRSSFYQQQWERRRRESYYHYGNGGYQKHQQQILDYLSDIWSQLCIIHQKVRPWERVVSGMHWIADKFGSKSESWRWDGSW
mmetsp:Transcript_31725/g.51378  ORF Transcript_31725/g.51378 Transcript_31725/m.51378 type:complete len:251 (-) Transcript_31725:199-951(-)